MRSLQLLCTIGGDLASSEINFCQRGGWKLVVNKAVQDELLHPATGRAGSRTTQSCAGSNHPRPGASPSESLAFPLLPIFLLPSPLKLHLEASLDVRQTAHVTGIS
jgi:hypothetical protein